MYKIRVINLAKYKIVKTSYHHYNHAPFLFLQTKYHNKNTKSTKKDQFWSS